MTGAVLWLERWLSQLHIAFTNDHTQSPPQRCCHRWEVRRRPLLDLAPGPQRTGGQGPILAKGGAPRSIGGFVARQRLAVRPHRSRQAKLGLTESAPQRLLPIYRLAPGTVGAGHSRKVCWGQEAAREGGASGGVSGGGRQQLPQRSAQRAQPCCRLETRYLSLLAARLNTLARQEWGSSVCSAAAIAHFGRLNLRARLVGLADQRLARQAGTFEGGASGSRRRDHMLNRLVHTTRSALPSLRHSTTASVAEGEFAEPENGQQVNNKEYRRGRGPRAA